MNKRKIEGLVIFLVGALLVFFGWFNYAVYTPASNTGSSRLKDLNWLHDNLGKIPTALLFTIIGIMVSFFAIKRFRK